MPPALPLLSCTFDDGTTVEVQPKPRDLARAEIAGVDFSEAGMMVTTNAMAWAALGRMSRAGDLPEGVEVADTFDGFLDSCDVVGPSAAEDDAEGEDTGQGPTSG